MKLVWISSMIRMEVNEQSQIYREYIRSSSYCAAKTSATLMKAGALRSGGLSRDALKVIYLLISSFCKPFRAWLRNKLLVIVEAAG